MAKKRKKPASELTTDEAMNRIFGKGAAVKLRQAVADLETQKQAKKRGKKDDA